MTMGIDQHDGSQLLDFNEVFELIPLFVGITSGIHDNTIPQLHCTSDRYSPAGD